MGQLLSTNSAAREDDEQDPELGFQDVDTIVEKEVPRRDGFRTIEDDFSHLTEQQRAEWANREFAIQPHTDEGGDAYLIGDAYDGITCAKEWEDPNPGKYLRFIKRLSRSSFPHLEYLGHWMEVSAAPPKWRFLRHHPENRAERKKRTNVCIVDYTGGKAEQPRRHNDTNELMTDLKAAPQNDERAQTRLIIVEDLCSDLVEALGSYYDVDPLFFLSHIGDYLFHNTRDPWVELPDLDLDARKRSHFSLQYLRARYYNTEEEFKDAEFESGMFNVLRRLDSDRSRKRLRNGLLDRPDASVTLTRTKTSLWIKPKKGRKGPVTAILLVDPTVKSGSALWGGYRPFEDTPSIDDWREDSEHEFEAPTRTNLFEDVVFWTRRMSPEDINMVFKDPRYIAFYMYRLVLADWLTVLKYMTTMLGKMEWEFEKPHWGHNPSDVDELLKKVSPWRRNSGYYQSMISEAIARLFPPEVRAPLHGLPGTADPSNPEGISDDDHDGHKPGVASLWTDFKNVKQQMTEIQIRIKSIELMTTNAINTEESRRAVKENARSVKQNKNLARVTFLATIFIPLNFTSSFLSISPDFSASKPSFWLFFAIGFPLTGLVIFVLYITQPKNWERFVMRHFGKNAKKPKEEPAALGRPRAKSVGRQQTRQWVNYNKTFYNKDKEG